MTPVQYRQYPTPLDFFNSIADRGCDDSSGSEFHLGAGVFPMAGFTLPRFDQNTDNFG